MSKRKISISIRDPIVYEYLRAQGEKGSISAYVCNLIRCDMEQPSEEDLYRKVEEIVRRLLQNTDAIEFRSPSQASNSLSNEDRELLKSLF